LFGGHDKIINDGLSQQRVQPGSCGELRDGEMGKVLPGIIAKEVARGRRWDSMKVE
jgi:hypothetical protein